METYKVANWIQITTGIAVLVGLGLVVWELEQSRDVAMAQLTSDGFGHFQQQTVARMGENSAIVLAKACHDSQALTDEELIVLDAYYNSLVAIAVRAYRIEKRTGLYEDLWSEVVQDNLPLVLSSSAGRTWWERDRVLHPLEFQRVAAAVDVSAFPVNECWVESWKQQIKSAGSTG